MCDSPNSIRLRLPAPIRLLITGDSPGRFTVSVGQKEMFGTSVENVPNRELGVGGVMSWYENSSTLTAETQSPEAQSTMPEVVAQTDITKNNQSLVLTITAVAVIVAITIAVKVTKKRNKKS